MRIFIEVAIGLGTATVLLFAASLAACCMAVTPSHKTLGKKFLK